MSFLKKHSRRQAASSRKRLGGLKLILGLIFVLLMLFINGINPTAVPDAQAIPLTFFLDWGALAPGTPVVYPYVEPHTNVNGSGIDVTLTIDVIGEDQVYRNPDPDGNVANYTIGSDVFRYYHQNANSTPVKTTVSFSQPVVIDEIMFGGNRAVAGITGAVEFAAFDGLNGMGNVVLPNPYVYPNPATSVAVTSPDAIPSTAPLNIIDGSALTYVAEYVPVRNSYVSLGFDALYHWIILDYEGAVVQSLSWEEYCTTDTNPQTARANLAAACLFNSAYLAGFNFEPAVDWGDLPDTGAGTGIGNYNTTSSDSGANHILDMDTYLGSCVEAESDGQPDTEAGTDGIGGDDGTSNFAVGSCTIAGDDEDGLSFAGNWSDGTAEMSVVSSADACLNVWLDYSNGTVVGSDGDFNDTHLTVSEHVIQNQLVSAGANNPTFTLPAGVANSATFYLRARLTPQDSGTGCANAEAYGGGVASPLGLAVGGEVEDYQINFNPTAVTLSGIESNNSLGILWLLVAAVLFALMTLFVVMPLRRKVRVAAK